MVFCFCKNCPRPEKLHSHIAIVVTPPSLKSFANQKNLSNHWLVIRKNPLQITSDHFRMTTLWFDEFLFFFYILGTHICLFKTWKRSFSYSNSSNTTIIKKLCKSKKLVKSQSGHTEMITSDLQRVFLYDHSVIWQVFLICKAF